MLHELMRQFAPAALGGQMLRLLVAGILAGVIGYEREFSSRKPAGFRTHILVGLGSALVMMTSEFAAQSFPDANLDPTRIGAQVVSGIGFLGAGAILRSGFSVKGLTTAASLWAVACVGIASGIGYYAGAALATLLVFLVLTLLKALEDKLALKVNHAELQIEARSGCVVIGEIQKIFTRMACTIRELHVEDDGADNIQQIRCVFEMGKGFGERSRIGELTAEIQRIEGVQRVYT
jgi:putative Mg2+ transporter-C (MgtC) family protein